MWIGYEKNQKEKFWHELDEVIQEISGIVEFQEYAF